MPHAAIHVFYTSCSGACGCLTPTPPLRDPHTPRLRSARLSAASYDSCRCLSYQSIDPNPKKSQAGKVHRRRLHDPARLIPWRTRGRPDHASESQRQTALAAGERSDEGSDRSHSAPQGGMRMPDQKAAANGASSQPTTEAETASDGRLNKTLSRFSAVSGPLLVLGVACLWGTNPIALRYLYKTDGATPCCRCLLSHPRPYLRVSQFRF